MLFLIGAAFGWRRGDRPSDARSIACAATANALAGIALPAVCYWRHPAWMLGYLVDPARVPLVAVVATFALYWVPFAIGYLTHSWKAIAGGLAAQIALIALTWPRYSTVTTMEGFAAGAKVPPDSIPLLAWGGPAAIAVVAILLLIARRASPR
jgi:hypothetical protein